MQNKVEVPSPPLNVVSPDPGVSAGEGVVVRLVNGDKIAGTIVKFVAEDDDIQLTPRGEDEIRKLHVSEVRIVNFPQPRHWVKAKSPATAAVEMVPERREFEIEFDNGSSFRGETLGFKVVRHGLHLFPTLSSEQFMHSFINLQTVKHYRVGDFLGELLVQDKVVEDTELNKVLLDQEQQRRQPLGEYLVSTAVVSQHDLEVALQRQRSMPNMRLGEILIAENLITDAQLERALHEQSSNRRRPLGEILVDSGLVSRDQIQRSLAKKLGIPYVNLKEFQIEPDIVGKVSEELASRHKVIPVMVHEGKLIVALENPMDWEAIDALKFHTRLQIEAVIGSGSDIQYALDFYYRKVQMGGVTIEDMAGDVAGAVDEDVTVQQDSALADNLVVKLINKIIVDAYNQQVSDIHVEPYPGNQKTVVRFRKDGSLINYVELPAQYKSALTSRIKVMASLDISERRKPQDGKIDFAKFGPLKIELRVATVPTAGGLEDVVMRILAAGEPVPLAKLGLSERNEIQIRDLVTKPYGLFLVCGPTGSGKTTTLHSILGYINTSERKIWTAEDPVEITQRGLRQVQVNPKIGMTFASTMRAFLRADPDVIMVGEMRDKETTSAGIEASLTGHMVFSTLHTNSAPESIVRLLDMGMDPFNFADALTAILAQRLAKRLCAKCSAATEASVQELSELAAEYCRDMPDNDEALRTATLEDWRKRFADKQGRFMLYRAKGCEACDNTGYRGRVGVHELLVATDKIKKAIIEILPVSELTKIAISEGMRTLKQDGIEKVLAGATDIHQVRSVCIK